MSEWRETSLENLCLDVSYGYTASANFENGHSKFLRITDIQNGTVNWEKVPYCSINHQNYQKYKLLDGDIVIARTGNSTGENYLFCGGENAVFASYLVRFRIDKNLANSRFVWYTLRTPNWWQFINNSKTGSAQAGANAKVLGSFPILLPPLSEQKAIAHILGSLDDKIELNRRMNETLEAMARAIFKDWFVDFGPTRAKIEGRAPYLPEPIWSLFPDAIDPQSGLPVGWGEATISKYLDVKRGGSPRPIQDYIVPKGIPWVKIADATSISSPFIFSTKEFIKPEGLKKTVKLNAGNLILSNSATPGLPKFLMLDACIHDGWLYFPKIDKFSKEYLYLLFLSIRQNLVGQGNGSIFTNLKIEIIKNQRIVDPPQTVINLFMSSIPSFFEKMLFTDNESRTLAELRDRL